MEDSGSYEVRVGTHGPLGLALGPVPGGPNIAAVVERIDVGLGVAQAMTREHEPAVGHILVSVNGERTTATTCEQTMALLARASAARPLTLGFSSKPIGQVQHVQQQQQQQQQQKQAVAGAGSSHHLGRLGVSNGHGEVLIGASASIMGTVGPVGASAVRILTRPPAPMAAARGTSFRTMATTPEGTFLASPEWRVATGNLATGGMEWPWANADYVKVLKQEHEDFAAKICGHFELPLEYVGWVARMRASNGGKTRHRLLVVSQYRLYIIKEERHLNRSVMSVSRCAHLYELSAASNEKAPSSRNLVTLKVQGAILRMYAPDALELLRALRKRTLSITYQLPAEMVPRFSFFSTHDRLLQAMLLDLPRPQPGDAPPQLTIAQGATNIFLATCSLLGAPCSKAVAQGVREHLKTVLAPAERTARRFIKAAPPGGKKGRRHTFASDDTVAEFDFNIAFASLAKSGNGVLSAFGQGSGDPVLRVPNPHVGAVAAVLKFSLWFGAVRARRVTLGDGGVAALFGAAKSNPLMHSVFLSDVGCRHKGVPSSFNGRLTTLCLSYNAFGAKGARDLAAGLADCGDTLLTLDLEGCRLDGASSAAIIEALLPTGLQVGTHAVLSKEASAKHLPAGGSTHHLRSLTGSGSDGFKKVKVREQVSHARTPSTSTAVLRSLNLSANTLGPMGSASLVRLLGAANRLTSLVLAKTSLLLDNVAHAVASNERLLRTLTMVDVSQNAVSLGGARALGELMAATRVLTKLGLLDVHFDKRKLRAFLETAFTNPHADFHPSLDLSENTLGGATGRVLAEVIRFSDARGMGVETGGVEAAPASKTDTDKDASDDATPRFRQLLLSKCGLGLKGVSLVVEALQERAISTLRVLGLSANASEKGFMSARPRAQLARSLPVLLTPTAAGLLVPLTHLYLAGDSKRKLSLPTLVLNVVDALVENRVLRLLDISNNCGGEKLGEALGRMLTGNSTLQHLDWDGNDTTVPGLRRVADAMEGNNNVLHLPLPVRDVKRLGKSTHGATDVPALLEKIQKCTLRNLKDFKALTAAKAAAGSSSGGGGGGSASSAGAGPKLAEGGSSRRITQNPLFGSAADVLPSGEDIDKAIRRASLKVPLQLAAIEALADDANAVERMSLVQEDEEQGEQEEDGQGEEDEDDKAAAVDAAPAVEAGAAGAAQVAVPEEGAASPASEGGSPVEAAETPAVEPKPVAALATGVQAESTLGPMVVRTPQHEDTVDEAVEVVEGGKVKRKSKRKSKPRPPPPSVNPPTPNSYHRNSKVPDSDTLAVAMAEHEAAAMGEPAGAVPLEGNGMAAGLLVGGEEVSARRTDSSLRRASFIGGGVASLPSALFMVQSSGVGTEDDAAQTASEEGEEGDWGGAGGSVVAGAEGGGQEVQMSAVLTEADADEAARTVDLDTICAIAEEAGAAIMNVYRTGFKDGEDPAAAEAAWAAWVAVAPKGDGSPLTAADLASNSVICDALDALPGLRGAFPIVSEEDSESVPWTMRRRYRHFWSIDPMDGTKEFLKRTGEFTVNIGLCEAGAPILGVVHVPATGKTYFGARGRGAFVRDGPVSGGTEARPISVADFDETVPGVVAVTSSSHANAATDAFLLSRYGESCTRTTAGSSLKLMLVAEGSAHVYPRFGPTSEWDTCAAHAILLEAGGECLQVASETGAPAQDGAPLRYNKESTENPFFVCYGRRLAPRKPSSAAPPPSVGAVPGTVPASAPVVAGSDDEDVDADVPMALGELDNGAALGSRSRGTSIADEVFAYMAPKSDRKASTAAAMMPATAHNSSGIGGIGGVASLGDNQDSDGGEDEADDDDGEEEDGEEVGGGRAPPAVPRAGKGGGRQKSKRLSVGAQWF